jgi:hypothetical protein
MNYDAVIVWYNAEAAFILPLFSNNCRQPTERVLFYIFHSSLSDRYTDAVRTFELCCYSKAAHSEHRALCPALWR